MADLLEDSSFLLLNRGINLNSNEKTQFEISELEMVQQPAVGKRDKGRTRPGRRTREGERPAGLQRAKGRKPGPRAATFTSGIYS